MAKPKTIKDDAQYKVTLTGPVPVGRRVLVPRLQHTIKGSVLKAIDDAKIGSAELVK